MRDISKAFADAHLLAGVATERAMNAPLPTSDGAVQWDQMRCLLVRLHPNTEIKVAERLNDHGIPVYVPQERWSRRTAWNRRVVDIRPIFDGLMFVPTDHRFADLRRMREVSSGIVGFIKFNDHFAVARPDAMAAICRMEERLSVPMGQRRYSLNQAVRVLGGPFSLWEGRIDRLDSKGRLRVLLDTIGSQVKVYFDETQIEPV